MILDTDFPSDVRVENEARVLHSRGFEIDLFSLCYGQYENPIEDFGFLKVHRYGGSKLLYKLSAIAHDFPLYNWVVRRKITKFLNLVRPDFIHVHDMVIAKAAFLACENSTCFKILDLHENRPAIMRHYPHTTTSFGKYLINLNKWEKMQLWLINRYDHVVVVTEEARDHYLETVDRKNSDFSIVSNTVDPLEFIINEKFLAVDVDPKEFNLLYIGNTGLRRGTLFLIELMAKLKKVTSEIKLVIVGSSSEDHILKSRAEELGLSSNVLFAGWKNPKSLPDYIDKSSVCFSPLTRNIHHDTTYANKIFQYMAGGKPLVVSDCPPQKRIVEKYDCGVSYEAQNMTDCLNKVVKLYNAKGVRNIMGHNGKKAIQLEQNFNKTSEGLVNFYLTSFSKMHT